MLRLQREPEANVSTMDRRALDEGERRRRPLAVGGARSFRGMHTSFRAPSCSASVPAPTTKPIPSTLASTGLRVAPVAARGSCNSMGQTTS